jgi:hypothetical protein
VSDSEKKEEEAPIGGRFSTPIFVGIAAGAILLVAFAVAILRQGDRPERPHLGAAPGPAAPGDGSAPSIVSPFGAIPHGALTLRWKKARDIEEYQAFILDNQTRIIWRSERVRADSVEVPDSGRDLLVPGPAFFWRVVGFASDGHEEPSSTVQFSVAR